MKKVSILLTIQLLFIVTVSFAQNWIGIVNEQPSAALVTLSDQTPGHMTLQVKVDGFYMQPVNTPKGEAFTISMPEATPLLRKGMPDLPKLATSLIIPDQANMVVRVTNMRYIDYPFIDIAPSKGNLLRTSDPAAVAFTYDRAYERDEYYPVTRAELREPYILRDYRGQTVVIEPFAYNPVSRTLRVYYEMTVEVQASGISKVNTLSRTDLPQSLDADFSKIYSRHFLNAQTGSRYTPLEEQGNMLIICYGNFMAAMQPFVDWKISTGIPTEIVDVATIGANSTAIKNYVANYYTTNGLTYLLLVGDNAQVPTVTTGSIGGPSDHAYGYLVGNDHYPDVFVGRFSAETEAQVTTQVSRTLEYEQNPQMSTDWFSYGVGIGSSEGPGDDGEYDYQHIRNIRTDLLGYTFTAVSELYDGSQGGEDLPGNPNSTSVANEVNAGRSIINYTGHGSQTSWGTTGFSNSGVNALTNNHMWPFIFSVACVNGDFLNGTCFAEAWLRATNANGPTGAVATLMSTINQSWNPPMEGQDEMDDILVESYANNIKRTFGGVSMNGCMKMNDSYGTDGSDMTDTWLIFGDPSLMVRTAMPQTLVVNHDPAAFIGATQFVVNSPANGAVACLTSNGQILGTATVTGGSAIITFPPLATVGSMHLVVTAFNYLPYITDISILPLNGPYVVYNTLDINDATGNGNQQLDYGESVMVALGLSNVGTNDAVDVNVTISSDDPYIVLGDTTEMYPLIVAGQTSAVEDGFAFSVSNDVPEGHNILFNFTASSGTDEWSGSFSVTAHSVAMNFAGFTVDDSQGNNNGKADPGETVQLQISIVNAGTAPAYNVYGLLTSTDPYIVINADSAYYGTLNGYETLTRIYTITSQPDIPSGHMAALSFNMMADAGFESVSPVSLIVGQIPVLIIDLDGNHNSGPVMNTCLSNISVAADYTTSWPLVFGPYQSIFVCLGTYANNAVLTDAQGQALATFLNAGGRVYMEGGDTWAYNTPTPVHPMFKIQGDTDGSGDLSTLNGITQSMTDGMSFSFGGDNSYIDRILPLETAQPIFQNQSPQYFAAIAYDGGTYKTIGSSFEFGGLQDAGSISVKDSLMLAYVKFFGITGSAPLLANFMASDEEVCEFEEITFTDFSAGNITSREWSFPGGNPETSTEQNPVVIYQNPGVYDVSLTVSDGINSNSITKSAFILVDYCMGVRPDENTSLFSLYPNPASDYIVIESRNQQESTRISIVNAAGQVCISTMLNGNGVHQINTRSLKPGIYMVQFNSQNYQKSTRLVITH